MEVSTRKEFSEAINTKIWEKKSRILCPILFLFQKQCRSDDPAPVLFFSPPDPPNWTPSVSVVPLPGSQLFANFTLVLG